jgi:hypothetical protein
MSAIMTEAPALASAVAMAAPMPRAPPVTKALWPDNCPLMAVLPFVVAGGFCLSSSEFVAYFLTSVKILCDRRKGP